MLLRKPRGACGSGAWAPGAGGGGEGVSWESRPRMGIRHTAYRIPSPLQMQVPAGASCGARMHACMGMSLSLPAWVRVVPAGACRLDLRQLPSYYSIGTYPQPPGDAGA